VFSSSDFDQVPFFIANHRAQEVPGTHGRQELGSIENALTIETLQRLPIPEDTPLENLIRLRENPPC
jgi:hypothetical protein